MKSQGKSVKGPSQLKTEVTAATKSFDPTLPILHFGGPNHAKKYLEWKKTMTTHCLKTFGAVAKIFHTLEEYEPPMVTIPDDLDDETDPGGFIRQDITEQIKNRRRMLWKMQENKASLYATIWMQLSIDSEQAVKKDVILQSKLQYDREFEAYTQNRDAIAEQIAQYGTIEDIPEDEVIEEIEEPQRLGDLGTWKGFEFNADPLALLKSIQRTHLAYATEFKVGDRAKARDDYAKLRQGSNESVMEFRERTEATIEALRAVGERIPADDALAADFVRRLHSRFDAFKVHLENGTHQGLEYPADLETAYILASQFKVVRESGRFDSGTSTVLIADKVNLQKSTQSNKKPTKVSSAYVKSTANSANKSTNSKSTNPTISAPIKKKDPSKPCPACSGKHWLSDCRWLKQAKDLATQHTDIPTNEIEEEAEYVNISVLTSASVTSSSIFATPTVIGLDTLSSIHVFGHDALLTNIHDNPDNVHIKGVDNTGTPLRPKFRATCKPFGEVYYDPRISANILSYGELCKDFKIVNDANIITVIVEGVNYDFHCTNNLFVLDLQEFVFLNTTNKIGYTQREYQKAREAKTFLQRLGFPSYDAACNALNDGTVINAPITCSDVRRAKEIFGSDIASLKGKATAPKPIAIDSNQMISNNVTHGNQILHLDIMNISGINILIGVSLPLGATLSEFLINKSTPTIASAIDRMTKKLATRNFLVQSLVSDGERSIIHPTLRNDVIPPGTHDPIVERKIRVIKERCRAIVSSLNYKLPICLVKHLVSYVITRINMLPSKSVHVLSGFRSPRENFYGRKLDYNKDLAISFGEFVQAYNPNNGQLNSLKERTEDGLALFPSGDIAGSIYVFNIATRKIVLRSKWYSIPITDSIKKLIESIDANHFKMHEADEDPTIADSSTNSEDFSTQPTMESPTKPDEVTDYQPTIESPTQSDEVTDYQPTTASPTQPDEVTDYQPTTASPTQSDEVTDYQPTIESPTQSDESTTAIESHMRPDESTDRSHNLSQQHMDNWSSRRNLRPFIRHAFHISLNKGLVLHPKRTLAAAVNEVSNILKFKTFTPIRPNLKVSQIIPTFMHLTEKYRPDGTFEKDKARFLAGGNRQDKVIYKIEETSSPTVSTSSMLSVLAIAAAEEREIATIDVVAAYLEAYMNGEVYIEIDKNTSQIFAGCDSALRKYIRPSGTIVARLNKALYGCVQSARAWYQHLSGILTDIGFAKNDYDPCVFNKIINGHQVTIACHVDDLLITSQSAAEMDAIIKLLKEKFTSIKVNRGKHHNFLGLVIDISDKGIKLSMKSYLEGVIKAFPYPISNPAASPSTGELYNIGVGEDLSEADAQLFHSTVAKCLYAAHRTRPDILLTTNFLATRVSHPTAADLKKLIRLLRYLFGTLDNSMNYYPNGAKPTEIRAYIDAAFAVHQDAKSRTGTCIFIANCLVNAKSAKQKLVTKDSTEAELVAASDDGSSAIHLYHFMCSQGYKMKPITLLQDNMSTIAMIRKGAPTGKRNRHIEVRYFFLKDKEEKGIMKIQYVPTAQMTADILTKPLQGELFRQHRRRLLNED